MKIGISSTEGVKECVNNLSKYLRKAETVTNENLEELAFKVKRRAIQLAPYKTGRLEAGVYVIVSRSATKPGIRAGAVAMHKGFNYAPIQHENESFEHPVKGEAKFVLKALEEMIPDYIKRTRKELSSFD